jgi:hypothetical protein
MHILSKTVVGVTFAISLTFSVFVGNSKSAEMSTWQDSQTQGIQIGPVIKVKTKKHRYCVAQPEGYNSVHCEDCWSRLGGEGGRVDCGARKGGGQVHYGRCSEAKNRRRCSNF